MHLSASMQSRKLLDGKNALVIGGAGYLGSEISRIFLQHGARVFIASRNLSKIEQFIDSLESDSLRKMVMPFSVDITRDDSVTAMTEFVGQKFSGV